MFEIAPDSSRGVCYRGHRYSCVIHLRLLLVVGFEASDEERMAGGQSLHEGVQRLTELTAQRRHLLGVVSLDLQG